MVASIAKKMRLLGRTGSHVLLVAVSSVLGLSLCEVGLRLFRPVEYLEPPSPPSPEEQRQSLYRPSQVPGLSYEMVPNHHGTYQGKSVRTNSLGMRGPEPAPPDPALFRVAVVGDSFTFGFGVSEEETYPSDLAAILKQSLGSAENPEVLNLGVVGYNSKDEAAVVARKALPLDPRVVVIGYVLNDPEIDPRPSLHKHFDLPVWWRHSHVLRRLHLGWNSLNVWRYGGGDYIRYLHARDRPNWQSVLAAFRGIGDLARGRGLWVLVVIFPMVPLDGWASYPYRDLHQQVAEAARTRGLAVLDLLPVFQRHPPRDLTLSTEDSHPSVFGHEAAARAIADAILAHRDFPPARDGVPHPSADARQE